MAKADWLCLGGSRQQVLGEDASAGSVDRTNDATDEMREWWRKSVVTSPPGLNLLFPVLLLRSLLVKTLQGSVVPLIQLPTTMYWQPHLVCFV
jgi:hypothetical protein